APPPASPATDSRHRLAGAGPPLWPISQVARSRQAPEHHRRRRRARAGGLHVGDRQNAGALRVAAVSQLGYGASSILGGDAAPVMGATLVHVMELHNNIAVVRE